MHDPSPSRVESPPTMRHATLALPLLVLAACSSNPTPAVSDDVPDASVEDRAAPDVAMPSDDVPSDGSSSVDAVTDASDDARADVAFDASRDASLDASADVAFDASRDASPDTVIVPDASPDMMSVDAMSADAMGADATSVDVLAVDATTDTPTVDASVGACRVAWHAALPNLARGTPSLAVDTGGVAWAVWFDSSSQVNATRLDLAGPAGAWRSSVRTVDLPTHPGFATWEGDVLRVATRSFLSPQAAAFSATGAVRTTPSDLVMGNGIERGPWIVRANDGAWVFWRRPAMGAVAGALTGVALDASGAVRGAPISVVADVSPSAIAWDGTAFVAASVDAGNTVQLTRFSTTGATLATATVPGTSPRITQVSLAVTATGLDLAASDLYRAWTTSASRDLATVAPWRQAIAYANNTEWATIAVSGARRAVAWADTRYANSTGTIRFARLDAAGVAVTPALDVYAVFPASPFGTDVRIEAVGASSWVLAWRSLPTATSAQLEGHVARVECPASP